MLKHKNHNLLLSIKRQLGIMLYVLRPLKQFLHVRVTNLDHTPLATTFTTHNEID